MSKRKPYTPRAELPNPLYRLVGKQHVGQADTDTIAMQLLVFFDAAKRGQLANNGHEFLTKHLIIASFVAARTKSKAFHDLVMIGYNALVKASDRETRLLDLTTGEYQSIKTALDWYLRALPKVEIGVMNAARMVADERLGIE